MEQTGIVKVRLRINAKGEFLNVEVVEPSPYEALNRAALDLVNGLGKFKPLPSSYRGSGEFDFPIRYSIERGS